MQLTVDVVLSAQRWFGEPDSPDRTRALESFVEAVRPIVLSLLAAKNLRGEAWEDAYVDVLCACVRRLPAYNPVRAQPSTFFYLVAKYALSDSVARMCGSLCEVPVPAPVLSGLCVGRPPPLGLALFSPLEVEILYRRIVDGESVRAVAKDLGMSSAKVRAVLRRCLALLNKVEPVGL